jgi:hypothetical protein
MDSWRKPRTDRLGEVTTQTIKAMKKFMCVAVLLLAALTIKAEVVAKDTVEYQGAWKMDKLTTTNSYGEVSVRYVCYLIDIVNSKGEPRRVPTDKATYESDKVTHIIFNIQDSGAKRIAKAVNVEAVRKAKADKAMKDLAKASEQ